MEFWAAFILVCCLMKQSIAQEIIGCGGFVKSEVEINFSLIEVGGRDFHTVWAIIGRPISCSV